MSDWYLMKRIVVPAKPDVPEPGLVPQADDAVYQDEGVEYPPKTRESKIIVIFEILFTSILFHKTFAKCLEALLVSFGVTNVQPLISLLYKLFHKNDIDYILRFR